MLCRATHNVAVQPLPHLVHLGNQVGIALAELACVGGFVALVVHLAMFLERAVSGCRERTRAGEWWSD